MPEIIIFNPELKPLRPVYPITPRPMLPFNDQAWQEMQNREAVVEIAREHFFGYDAFKQEIDESLRAAWFLNKRFKATIPKEMVHSTTDFYRKVRDGWYVSIQEVLESIAGRWAANLHPDFEADSQEFLTQITLDSFKARRKTADDIAQGNKLLKTLIQLLSTQHNIGEVKFRKRRPIWEEHAVDYVARLRGCPNPWH